jgi:predicted nucleic acid-binding protein
MPTLIDSSLWIAFTRARTPRALKQLIMPYILAEDAALAEPIIFEVMRHATEQEARMVQMQFDTIPLLATPDDLWTGAAKLGQSCRRNGISAGSLDLLIVAVAIHHQAEVITFDRDFQNIAQSCDLSVTLLQR